MKRTFNLTQSDNQVVLVPQDGNKAISIRGAFAKGTGIGQGGEGMILVTFSKLGSGPNNFFNGIYVNDNQSLSNPDSFNYYLTAGKEIVVEALAMKENQSIYMEVDYEEMDI